MVVGSPEVAHTWRLYVDQTCGDLNSELPNSNQQRRRRRGGRRRAPPGRATAATTRGIAPHATCRYERTTGGPQELRGESAQCNTTCHSFQHRGSKMVDIASPNVTSRQNGSPIDTHDAETFRVAEELMLLSASKARRSSGKDGAYDTSLSHETQRNHPAQFVDRASFARSKRHKALGAQFDTLKSPATVVNHPFARDNIATAGEMIINSLSDVSHSQLLSEHRSRFRRTRRRWNIESANKQKAYLARFHVQGIPLVEHLASLR